MSSGMAYNSNDFLYFKYNFCERDLNVFRYIGCVRILYGDSLHVLSKEH